MRAVLSIMFTTSQSIEDVTNGFLTYGYVKPSRKWCNSRIKRRVIEKVRIKKMTSIHNMREWIIIRCILICS